FLKQLAEFWATLSLVKRVSLVVATAAVLVGVLVAAEMSGRIEYSYLFTDLSTEDAAAIAEKLKAMKVPYRIQAGGTALEVPEERVHQLRLELASAGLPRGGGVGFEIFDRSNLGETEFEQHINLRRALEGELSRSISTIDGVQSARVHLVLPENRLFTARKEQASASVVLKLRPSKEFGRREVAGIVHLVAAAVPGLSHDRVSVVSTEGVTLHRPVTDEGGGTGGDGEDEQARDMAAAMENHVRSLLERMVGPGNTDVRVHIDLSKASRERTEEHYEPTKTALRSEHKTEESTGAEGASVAGVPGAQTNLPHTDPGAATTETASNGGNVFRTTQTRNWEVDRVTEKTNMPAGGTERLSVAVLVDGSYVMKGGKSVFVPRSKEQIEQLDAIVKNAVGFDEKRGDSVRVEATQFARLEEEPVPEPRGFVAFAKKSPAIVAGAAFGLATLIAITWLLLARRRRVARAEAEAAQLAAHQSPLAGALGAGDVAAGALPEGAASGPTSAELRAEALQIASRDPATAAIILKKWLNAPAAPAQAA
ncbi:MAG TPA: flagellar basal-body MS-ring/collar protein FliF, partial [Minicystis sp.]|nr:flagellar basal-body MS-ring/collar protein FliF [Minicystis sp.]